MRWNLDSSYIYKTPVRYYRLGFRFYKPMTKLCRVFWVCGERFYGCALFRRYQVLQCYHASWAAHSTSLQGDEQLKNNCSLMTIIKIDKNRVKIYNQCNQIFGPMTRPFFTELRQQKFRIKGPPWRVEKWWMLGYLYWVVKWKSKRAYKF